MGKADTGLDNRSGEALVDQLQPTSPSIWRRHAPDPERLPPPASQMGDRENIRMADHQPKTGCRLREIAGNRRDIHLHGYEPHLDEASNKACTDLA